MVGKQLSALLQILRSNGVVRYQTTELTLELGPPPAPKAAPRSLDEVIQGIAGAPDDDADDEEGDPRFSLERLTPRHFPRPVADPRKNKASQ